MLTPTALGAIHMVEGWGENPEEALDPSDDGIALGRVVYDEDGNSLGRIRGVEAGGFFVSIREGYASFTSEHAHAGGRFGEAELMWRCTECGEMGEIDAGLPENCPNCDTIRENLMYWTED